MLEARGLHKSYDGLVAVRDVSFSIKPGEVLGYLGPNGSGKSTTVKMLTGLIEPTRGEVWFEGVPISRCWAEYRRRLGYVPEEPHLYPFLSGVEYLQLVGRLRGVPERALNAKIEALLELLALRGSSWAPISSYSKGMRQKVLLAAAILHDPDVLIFDEPLSGLDVTAPGHNARRAGQDDPLLLARSRGGREDLLERDHPAPRHGRGARLGRTAARAVGATLARECLR
jgi:ABC-2 type transport system ATP-binding protein